MEDDRIETLTERQRDCLRLVYTHYTISEIAGQVGLSVEGVNYHLAGARRALGANSSAQAARMIYGNRPPSDYIPHVAVPNAVGCDTPSDKLAPSPPMEVTPPMVREERAEFGTEVSQPAPTAPSLDKPGTKETGDTRSQLMRVLDWVSRLAGVAFMLLALAYAFSIYAHHHETEHHLGSWLQKL